MCLRCIGQGWGVLRTQRIVDASQRHSNRLSDPLAPRGRDGLDRFGRDGPLGRDGLLARDGPLGRDGLLARDGALAALAVLAFATSMPAKVGAT